MTSITGTQGHAARMSPRDMLQKELEQEVSSGTVSSSDESALSSALDSIGKSLKSDATSGTSATPASPEEMQKKISSLIDAQVKAGSLTSDQGTELKKLFSTVDEKMEAHRGRGPEGGPGAPPDGDGDDAASAGGSTGSLSKSDVAELFKAFLHQLKESGTTTTGYTDSGSTSSTTASSLVLDTKA